MGAKRPRNDENNLSIVREYEEPAQRYLKGKNAIPDEAFVSKKKSSDSNKDAQSISKSSLKPKYLLFDEHIRGIVQNEPDETNNHKGALLVFTNLVLQIFEYQINKKLVDVPQRLPINTKHHDIKTAAMDGKRIAIGLQSRKPEQPPEIRVIPQQIRLMKTLKSLGDSYRLPKNSHIVSVYLNSLYLLKRTGLNTGDDINDYTQVKQPCLISLLNLKQDDGHSNSCIVIHPLEIMAKTSEDFKFPIQHVQSEATTCSILQSSMKQVILGIGFNDGTVTIVSLSFHDKDNNGSLIKEGKLEVVMTKRDHNNPIACNAITFLDDDRLAVAKGSRVDIYYISLNTETEDKENKDDKVTQNKNQIIGKKEEQFSSTSFISTMKPISSLATSPRGDFMLTSAGDQICYHYILESMQFAEEELNTLDVTPTVGQHLASLFNSKLSVIDKTNKKTIPPDIRNLTVFQNGQMYAYSSRNYLIITKTDQSKKSDVLKKALLRTLELEQIYLDRRSYPLRRLMKCEHKEALDSAMNQSFYEAAVVVEELLARGCLRASCECMGDVARFTFLLKAIVAGMDGIQASIFTEAFICLIEANYKWLFKDSSNFNRPLLNFIKGVFIGLVEIEEGLLQKDLLSNALELML